MNAWPVLGISIVEAILLLAHWFLYHTLVDFWSPLSPAMTLALRTAFLVLGFSFVAAALLGFRFDNAAVRIFYKLAAVWLGFLNFFFWAAWLCWLVDLCFRLSAVPPPQPIISTIFFSLALLAGLYGLFNARWVRVRRVTVNLPALPSCWRGRTALLLTDLHLGNINGPRFARRMVRFAERLRPGIIFIPGDLFDGTHVDPDRLLAPFKELAAPLGKWFASGNHEEFGDVPRYFAALQRAGFRVLSNQGEIVDGVRILGVDYHDSTSPLHLRAVLERLHPDASVPSILLSHMPSRLPIVEQAGITLQLSGHTHGGQIFPFTWLTRRVFGEFTYGLHRFGSLQIYTSSGAGTWGPPMRVGTNPEVVVLTFA